MMRSSLALLAAGIAAGGATLPATSSGATLSGPARLSPTGPAAAGLAKQGVRIVPQSGAVPVATAGLMTYVLPAGEATFGTTTRLRLGGTLALRRTAGGRTRTVRLTALQLRLGRTSRALTAKLAGQRLDLLTLDLRRDEYTADAATTVVRIDGARAVLTPAAARAIARGLGLRTVRRGTFGVLAATASAPAASGAPGSAASGTPAPGEPAQPGGGAGTAPAGTAFAPPTPMPRPAGAVDIAASTLRWHLRESFVRYVKSGEGVSAGAGAAPGAPAADGTTYDYDFTPAGGWYDAATATGRLLFKGQITFGYAAHGIDIRFADPQVELAGERSRMLATFTSAKAGGYRGLGEFVALDRASASTTGTAGPIVVLSSLPARVTPWANDAVMSGFYPVPDDAFGWLDLRFTRGA